MSLLDVLTYLLRCFHPDTSRRLFFLPYVAHSVGPTPQATTQVHQGLQVVVPDTIPTKNGRELMEK